MIQLELRQKAYMAEFLIKNYDQLDENGIQELIEFAERRGGFFREDLKRFSIRKRAPVEYLEEIFKCSGIDVCITEPHYEVFKAARNMPPKELETTINFGKYKGEKWGDLPAEYLMWIKGAMQGHNADIAASIISYRKAQEKKTD